MDINYDFENKSKKEKEKKYIPPNLRVTRCCGNCKFFIRKTAAAHRGFCKQPDPETKNLYKRSGQKFDKKEMLDTWPRVHSTMLCDLYQVQHRYHCIDLITKWINHKISNNGVVSTDEESDTDLI